MARTPVPAGNDFWLFDKKLIRFSYFSGDGHILEDEMVSDRAGLPALA